MSGPDPADVWRFPGLAVGHTAWVYADLASTNDTAANLPPGEAVVALHQSAGRGQYGRAWASRPGASLLLSLAVAPADRRPVALTAWAAVAVADALGDLAGLSPRLKWPNDLLVDGRKICGILIEQGAHVVVGVGLNLAQTADEFTAAGLPAAASVATAAGKLVTVREAAGAVLAALAAWHPAVDGGDPAPLETAWAGRLALTGAAVAVGLADGAELVGRLRRAAFAGLELDVGGGGVVTVAPERVRRLSEV